MLRHAVLVVALAACDPTIHTAPADPGAAPVVAGDGRAGQLHETCGATRDCAAPLRCVAATCTPGVTSRLGEVLWSRGRGAAARGSAIAAAEAFQQAAAQYETDKVPVPAGLLCDHGAFLRRQSSPAASEQAARLLHRCLLGTPSGSPLHERALAELARLAPRGLDAALLARDTPADSYLVQKPVAPTAAELTITVARSEPAADRGYEAFARALEGPAARAALAGCFAAQWETTFLPSLSVVLSARHKGGALDLGGGDGCARAALAPLAAGAGASGPGWQGSYTITIVAGDN